jgi:hypothetical protein
MHDAVTESQDTTELCDVYLVGSELCGVCCVLGCVGSGFQVQGLGSGTLDPMRATLRQSASSYNSRIPHMMRPLNHPDRSLGNRPPLQPPPPMTLHSHIFSVFLLSQPSNRFSHGTHHCRLFGHKNRSRVNAKNGLIGNDKLPYKVLLIVSYQLVHVTLDSQRQQHVLPIGTALKR